MFCFSKHILLIKFLICFLYINGQEINADLFYQTLLPITTIKTDVGAANKIKRWDKQNFKEAFNKHVSNKYYAADADLIKAFTETLSTTYINQLNYLFAYKNYLENYFSNELSDDLLKKNFLFIAAVMSGYNNLYVGQNGIGLWRFSYINAIRYKLRIDDNFDYRFCPIASTKAAIDYYSYLLITFDNNEDLALAAFLSSPVMVKNHQTIEKLPQAIIYQLSLFKALVFLEAHKDSFIKEFHIYEPEKNTDTITVSGTFHFEQISLKANIEKSLIIKLNPVFKRPYIDDSTLSVQVVLPVDVVQYVTENIEDIKNHNDSLYFGLRKFIDIDERLLSAEHTLHYIKRGETLSGIARKYPNVSIDDIMHLNNLSSPDRIREGQELKIPKK